jgi:glutamyl-tRNA synthetase
MSGKPLRTRVAPSPTGDPHVGTAYQALFNYAVARAGGGRFVLRIEDTDRARSTPESERAIIAALRWLGLEWDEGPDVGGPHGPYRQSERSPIYREHAERLVDAGHAYRSFMTREQLAAWRVEQREHGWQGFRDSGGREAAPDDARRRAEAGEPHVIRLRVPNSGECVMPDLLRGEIRKEWAQIDDQILIKSDGFPTYHLANVVDDHLMEISHVLRGEEWISSLPKHLLLYDAFGWRRPAFCHLPLLRNADKSKLSKRRNPTSIDYYRRAGFLPEALVNFLGLLGWSMPEGDEKFTLQQFVERFRIDDVSLGGPVFDVDKLRWLNGRYIREDLDTEALLSRLENWALGRDRLAQIVPLVQPRLQTLSDWGYLTAFFFSDEVPVAAAELTIKGKEAPEVAEALQIVTWRLEQLADFSTEAIEATIRELADALGMKLRELTRPMYVAVTGSSSSTPLYQSMEILGPDLVRVRLRRAVDALGGLSTKRLKALDRRFAELFGPRD